MAAPPPLPLTPAKKKSGCFRAFLIVSVILFGLFSLPAITGHLASERKWKDERPALLKSTEEALRAGDYEKALSLTGSHRYREDQELHLLITNAEGLKRKAAEQKRREQISKLVADIRVSEGAARGPKLKRLLEPDPNTVEFPDEISVIRESIRQLRAQAEAKQQAEQQAQINRKEQVQQDRFRKAMEAELAQFKWRYQISPDELTSKPSYYASVQSINRVNFGFPYQGEQRGQLMLRTHPQHGKDLIVSVEKGQMLVRSYEDTTIKVVFDDGSPISYKVSGAADHSTTSLFVRDYHGFVQRMVKAKKLKISVPFYQQGNVVFEFNVSNFENQKYLGKP